MRSGRVSGIPIAAIARPAREATSRILFGMIRRSRSVSVTATRVVTSTSPSATSAGSSQRITTVAAYSAATTSSVSGYLAEMVAPQQRAFPRSRSQDTTGTLS